MTKTEALIEHLNALEDELTISDLQLLPHDHFDDLNPITTMVSKKTLTSYIKTAADTPLHLQPSKQGTHLSNTKPKPFRAFDDTENGEPIIKSHLSNTTKADAAEMKTDDALCYLLSNGMGTADIRGYQEHNYDI